MNVVVLILLIAAVQGISLAALILHKHGRLFANRFLAFMLLMYSAVLLDLMLWDLGISTNYPHLLLLADGLPFLLGPLHYLYVKYLSSSKRFERRDWLHCLPFVFWQLSILPHLLKPGPEILAFMESAEGMSLSLSYTLFNWALIVQGLTYMALSIVLLRTYSRRITDVFSSLEKVRLGWLRNITYMAILSLVVFLIENWLFLLDINLSNNYSLSSTLVAIYVYALGYLGLLRSEVFSQQGVSESIGQLQRLAAHSREEDGGSKKYEKSGLTKARASQYLRDLMALMQSEKPYRDSELTLTKLADMLSVSPHNLSEVINTQVGQNFFDFVNQYRVKEVKHNLANKEMQHFTLLALGLEAGFNSKSSFNAIFKKHTGATPSEFRNNLRSAG